MKLTGDMSEVRVVARVVARVAAAPLVAAPLAAASNECLYLADQAFQLPLLPLGWCHSVHQEPSPMKQHAFARLIERTAIIYKENSKNSCL